MTAVLAVGLAADGMTVHPRQAQASVGHQQLVVRIIAGEACGGARPGYHERAVPGRLGRDAHGRVIVHASPCDINRFAGGKIDILDHVAHLVVADCRVAREAERAVAVHATDRLVGRVVRDGTAGHSERAVAIDAAGSLLGRVVGDGTAGHVKRATFGVEDAAAVLGRVAGDTAAGHGKSAGIVYAAAVTRNGVPGDTAASHGKHAGIVYGTGLGRVVGDAATMHLKRAGIVYAAPAVRGRVVGDASIPEGEGTAAGNADTTAHLAIRMGDAADGFSTIGNSQ